MDLIEEKNKIMKEIEMLGQQLNQIETTKNQLLIGISQRQGQIVLLDKLIAEMDHAGTNLR